MEMDGYVCKREGSVEIIFTNNDMLTESLPFENGGYYVFNRLLYKAGSETTSVRTVKEQNSHTGVWFDSQGRIVNNTLMKKGLYIISGEKILVK